MNFKRLLIFAAAAGAVFTVESCKKDKDDTYTESKTIPGTLKITVPKFIGVNESVTIMPEGVKSDTLDIGYWWTAKPLYDERDTTRWIGAADDVTGAYKFVATDTLCTVTVACNAFSPGYSTQSVSSYCTIVNPELGGSIQNDGIDEDTPVFTDSRDGRDYRYMTIGNRDWFVRNLAWNGAGSSFQGCAVMDGIYGRYYTWNEAVSACPDGWRLPSDDDWLDLAASAGYAGMEAGESFIGVAGALMADARFNTEKMWEYWPAVKITNKTGFAAIPAGYGTAGEPSSFSYDFEYAVFWSSESSESDGDGLGVYRMINVNRPDFIRGGLNKNSFAASVRCVRDVK